MTRAIPHLLRVCLALVALSLVLRADAIAQGPMQGQAQGLEALTVVTSGGSHPFLVEVARNVIDLAALGENT